MQLVEIEIQGETFVWDGERWYNKMSFQAPTPATLVALSRALYNRENQGVEEGASAGA